MDARRVVGIGASAGGLEALEQLFGNLPSDTGNAYVVVQHLSPDFRSLMDELIARRTAMPVVMATDGVRLAANHVYVMPPGKHMIVRGERLVLTERAPQAFSLPIDTFFRALAHDLGDRAVAIVLSGSGSDGSRGIVEVKEAGGLVLAETVQSARFDGMPGAAAATGILDHTGTPAELARVVGELPPPGEDDEPVAEGGADPLAEILGLIHTRFGLDFTKYRTTTVRRRILRRISFARVASPAAYLEQLRGNADELDALYRDLLIGVTEFFRDPEAFEILERTVLPQLLEALEPDQDLRVWVAGCATGEEAYSVAMLCIEAFARAGREPRVRVLATDVHEGSLAKAAAGVYGGDTIAHLSEERLARFFVHHGEDWAVSRELRSAVVFARQDLTRDAPFTRMHLITCRNVIIYLQPAVQRAVLALFHFGLLSNGFLFLGASENPVVLGDEYLTIDERWRLYQKQRDAPLVTEARTRPLQARAELPVGDRWMLAIYDQLLDLHMPPGFLLDADRNLLDSFAGAEQLLRAKARRPTRQLLEMLDEELRVVIGSALQRLGQGPLPVSYTNVRIDLPHASYCTVNARSLRHPRTGHRYIVITFDEPRTDVARAPGEVSAGQASTEQILGLEADLAQARERLQATVEELQSSNEELVSVNEELIASNEELQSTNEELQSVNEELHTVNAEHQRQLAELRELYDDVNHLLEGTDIGTLFLDRDLRIRRFTSRTATVFRFKPADVGRHIGDFAHSLVRPQLFGEIAAVRDGGPPVEDEVRDTDGRVYFLRILPHRTRAGVILSLTDITRG